MVCGKRRRSFCISRISTNIEVPILFAIQMPKTRQQKENIVQDLQEKLSQAKAVVFADYYGLTVKEMEDLRKSLKEMGGQYLVTKKNLLKIALEKIGLSEVNLEGGISLAIHNEDEVLPAKILDEFSKSHEALKIQGGILEGKFVDLNKIQELAKLPGKKELIGKLVYLVKSPLEGIVGVLQGNLRGLVCVLTKITSNR
jgi:large subunit ribosomal protein L10